MKKLFSLLVAIVLVLNIGMIVFAEGAPAIDPETVFDFDRESHVTAWEGEWVLASAYIGEGFAEDCGIEVSGLIAVPENAVTMTVVAELDRSATGSDEGVMVDQANYWHAHVYDMVATVNFAADIADDSAELVLAWDGWETEGRIFGEADVDLNKGVGQLSKVSCDDKSLYFTTVTGVESEDIDDEKVKYVGMNTSGQLIVCYCEKNLVKNDVEIAFGYIFVRADAE